MCIVYAYDKLTCVTSSGLLLLSPTSFVVALFSVLCIISLIILCVREFVHGAICNQHCIQFGCCVYLSAAPRVFVCVCVCCLHCSLLATAFFFFFWSAHTRNQRTRNRRTAIRNIFTKLKRRQNNIAATICGCDGGHNCIHLKHINEFLEFFSRWLFITNKTENNFYFIKKLKIICTNNEYSLILFVVFCFACFVCVYESLYLCTQLNF